MYIVSGIALIFSTYIGVKLNNKTNLLEFNTIKLEKKLDKFLADNEEHIKNLEKCQRELAMKALEIAINK